jgi:hypothetical protein
MIRVDELTSFDLASSELPADLTSFEVEALSMINSPAAGTVSTWGSVSTFSSASCPAGCASTKATASTVNCQAAAL